MPSITRYLLLPFLCVSPILAAFQPDYQRIFGEPCATHVQATHNIIAPIASDLVKKVCNQCGPERINYELLQKSENHNYNWAILQLKGVGFELRESYVPEKLFNLVWDFCIKKKWASKSLCDDDFTEFRDCVLHTGVNEMVGPFKAYNDLVQRRCHKMPAAAARMVPLVKEEVNRFMESVCPNDPQARDESVLHEL
ncbi:hypothetical protein EYZ11_005307 [Aspergillus tanneri]|uniref:Uncharacterized protein n=1 Tax=Aspergillus tanneri TaxID=1220188 RepID=A0A4S3JIX7_9EURO|nr:uncharacterized protein ATNIH1004_009122 [Aspergillus tanneri]KAA8644911.1 hypothetical protein ATNIH1004_009122 [Aspergillus tanneri]THC95230.1 hypothetical protein EYZ11_005307 [Aspergillus tanneri]